MPQPRRPEGSPIRLTINGRTVQATASARSLLLFLREDLDMVGTKDGCSEGDCGACTVIVDGHARKSCQMKLHELDGRQVQTIEALAADGHLHPLQRTWAELGAAQCGACTTGFIMTAKALLDANPDPSVEQIQQALQGNICRCAEYQHMIPAIQRAAADARGEVIQPVLELHDKVQGGLRYAGDVKLPGMLHLVAKRSDHPHAEIVSIDTATAAAMPGVVRVFTHKDVNGTNRFGLISPDQPILADDKVRYPGDAVALVAAESREQAAAAAAMVQVTYRLLPVVTTPEQALFDPDCPVVNAVCPDRNVLYHTHMVDGDPEAGFAAADVIIEADYETPMVEHGYIERESGYAYLDDDGRLVVVAGGQNPHSYQRQLALALGVPLEQVRVIQSPTGGSFGGKHDMHVQPHVALATLLTGRPSKMVWGRRESIVCHPKRHAAHMHYKLGARRDGTLTALQARIVLDSGAYASEGLAVVEAVTCFAAGPYRLHNVDVEAWGAYTNNPPCGAFRGFGVPQVCFAMESQMNRLAAKLGLDPFELRRRNGLRQGDHTATGQLLDFPVPFLETLDRAQAELAQLTLPEPGPDERIGIGIGCSIKNSGMGLGVPERVGAIAELAADGCFTIYTGAVDMGQGTNSGQVQIAARVLGVPEAQVRLVSGDTDLTPDCGPTVASRQLMVSGFAIMRACEGLVVKMAQTAARELMTSQERMTYAQGRLYDPVFRKTYMTAAELAARLAGKGETLRMEAFYEPPRTVPLPDVHMGTDESRFHHFSYAWGTQVAVVRANLKTGAVRCEQVIAVHDIGKIIHRSRLEGQIIGSVVQGSGFALSEELILAGGEVQNPRLAEMGIPNIRRAPHVIPVLLEVPDPYGPFGAKGVAETASIATAAAIAGAVADATGARVSRLPIKPHRVLAALAGPSPAQR